MDHLDLKSLFLQNPDCVYSRKKLRATLLDLYPEHRQDVSIILLVYDSGLLTKIREKGSLAPLETAAMCSKIENEYGIPPELTVKAIAAWCEVLGTSASAAITPAPKTAPATAPSPVTEPTSKPTPMPIRAVQGSVDEYVIEERQEISCCGSECGTISTKNASQDAAHRPWMGSVFLFGDICAITQNGRRINAFY